MNERRHHHHDCPCFDPHAWIKDTILRLARENRLPFSDSDTPVARLINKVSFGEFTITLKNRIHSEFEIRSDNGTFFITTFTSPELRDLADASIMAGRLNAKAELIETLKGLKTNGVAFAMTVTLGEDKG